MANIAVIGSGFAGLTAAAVLAQAGHQVELFEKNETFGGRARQFKADGFTFDMGPSWYWMPEVFEDFFKRFDKSASDFYDLQRLDPSYTIYYEDGQKIDVPADYQALQAVFEQVEAGSSRFLDRFLAEAEYKYKVGMEEFVWKPSLSLFEFMDLRIVKSMFRLQMFSDISSHIRRYIKSPQLRQLLEFPVLFLGATPQKTPGLYSLMNYADLKLGTWYPMGGMHRIIEAMVDICVGQGVAMHRSSPVSHMDGDDTGLRLTVSGLEQRFDYVVAGADYHHIDQQVLAADKRSYSPKYWDSRAMAPSSLLFYLGLSNKLPNIHHHNLFFDADFDQHAAEIYTMPKWPSKPLFYACCPSKTDASVAPADGENLFLLMPLAPGLKDDPKQHDRYLDIMLNRLEPVVGHAIKPSIRYNRAFSLDDFKRDYNAFKGNAYGLANTLMQTAFLKPRMQSRKLPRLYYAGQLTTPGPGMPPSIISGQVAAAHILSTIEKKRV